MKKRMRNITEDFPLRHHHHLDVLLRAMHILTGAVVLT